MGPLLLLTYTLMSSYFLLGRVVEAQRSFTIQNVILSIEPSTDVTRGTNVTVRCKAVISSSGLEALSRGYTIYKGNSKLYTKTSSTSEDLLYQLPEARVSNTGKYKCRINIEANQMDSEVKRLTVTGLSKPLLHINNQEVNEGEEVTARCTAPGETGSIFFYFYEDSKVIAEDSTSSNQLETQIRFSSTGIHRIHCTYTVVLMPDSIKSNESNVVSVSVNELAITPVLEIFPQSNIYEGDQLNISCKIRNLPHTSESFNLYLSQGTKLLSSGVTEVNHVTVALAKDPGDFECRLELGRVTKVTTQNVSVTELFSVPTLTMSPAEVFQKENMTLTCKSKSYDTAKLAMEKLTYTLDPPESPLTQRSTGVFYSKALQYDFNYTCVAQAKGIEKRSQILTVRPKVSVSTPKISVVGRPVLGQRFKILCRSDAGSLPINFTLLKDDKQLSTTSIRLPSQKAHFTATITKPDEITKYRCEARNGRREALISSKLNVTVIVPLSQPTLIIHPPLSDMSEGTHLLLICSIKGTPPVTFNWYREGNEQPLLTETSHEVSMDYQVESLSKEDSGKYYCEAVNYANNTVRSEVVDINVHLALWKKVLIGGFCLLVVLVLLVTCVLYFISRRGKREAAAELSVKPSSPKSDDSLTVNLTHNTEVYNAATASVDRGVVSVWSARPPEAANDEMSSVLSSEPDVEYTEVVHAQPVDPDRAPLRKGTDTVYSELKNSPHGAAEHHDYGSVQHAELNSEQPKISHCSPEVNNYQDLPVPVD